MEIAGKSEGKERKLNSANSFKGKQEHHMDMGVRR